MIDDHGSAAHQHPIKALEFIDIGIHKLLASSGVDHADVPGFSRLFYGFPCALRHQVCLLINQGSVDIK